MIYSNKTASGQWPPGIRILIFSLIWALAMMSISSPLFAGPDEARLREEYIKLKNSFEKEVRTHQAPHIVACLSVETTALAWGYAAAYLLDSDEWLEKAGAYETSRHQSANWENRHCEALKFFWEALLPISIIILESSPQPRLTAELAQIADEAGRRLVELESLPGSIPEEQVVLSGALAGMMGILVKVVGGAAMEESVNLILKDMALKAEVVESRQDLHYRGRNALTYAGNLQGLTSLVFLLGRNAGPPLSRDLAKVHGSLNRHGAGKKLPDAICLTWTAQAQAALPLAYWLATHADASVNLGQKRP